MQYIEEELEYYKNKPRYTDKELLLTFPEGKKILKNKIALYTQETKNINNKIRDLKNKYSSTHPIDHYNIDFEIGLYENKREQILKKITKLNWLVKEDLLNSKELQVDRAKETPIQNFVDCKRIGYNFVTLCIFHNDNNPSLVIFKNNRFKCFACGASGDSIDFIKQLNNLDFVGAVKWITSQ